MNITFIRSELCDLLEVNDNALKSIIKRGKLEDRLNAKGYTLVKQYKEGRNTIYELAQKKVSEIMKIIKKYDIRKSNEFNRWAKCRLLLSNGLTMNRRQIISDCNIAIDDRTAKKFDDILVEEGLLIQKGNIYARKNRNNIGTSGYQWELTTEDYYKNYFAEQGYYTRLLSSYNYKLRNNAISQKEYDSVINNTYNSLEITNRWEVCRYTEYGKTDKAIRFIALMKNKK